MTDISVTKLETKQMTDRFGFTLATNLVTDLEADLATDILVTKLETKLMTDRFGYKLVTDLVTDLETDFSVSNLAIDLSVANSSPGH